MEVSANYWGYMGDELVAGFHWHLELANARVVPSLYQYRLHANEQRAIACVRAQTR
jgi:hypothetical protein